MTIPPGGTVERWAFDYVVSTSLADKLAPPPLPDLWEEEPRPRRLDRPGRPPELVLATGKRKTPRPGALRRPERRAELIHTFFHHELQASELFAWAVLAFPEAPRPFRRGLLTILRDELRHMALYNAQLIRLGSKAGAFPVNDWFWSRLPQAPTPAHFAATMGIGLEGANLDHARRFSAQLEAAGDPIAAAVEAQIADEEVPHVAFALYWFERLAGPVELERWRQHLPEPLSPIMMRGVPLDLERRRRAGFGETFLRELSEWGSRSPGS